jgi:hypothetical protein
LEGEWVVSGDAGSEVKLKLLSPECGDRELTIKLDIAPAPAGAGSRP